MLSRSSRTDCSPELLAKSALKFSRQGLGRRIELFRNGMYASNSIIRSTFVVRHHSSWTLGLPEGDATTSASQNMLFQEPIEVPAIIFTFFRQPYAFRNSWIAFIAPAW